MFFAVFVGISGKSAQLPDRALKALRRLACAFSSLTINPSALLMSVTDFELIRNAFGRRSACELPDLNTLADAVVIVSTVYTEPHMSRAAVALRVRKAFVYWH